MPAEPGDEALRGLEPRGDAEDGAPIFRARNNWELRYAQKQFPDVVLSATRERVAAGHGED